MTTTESAARPLFSIVDRGTCGLVGCDETADIETQVQIGPSRWLVSLTCLDHAHADQLDWFVEASSAAAE